VVVDVALSIRTDVGTYEEDLAVPYVGVALLDVGLPFPDGLYLRAMREIPASMVSTIS